MLHRKYGSVVNTSLAVSSNRASLIHRLHGPEGVREIGAASYRDRQVDCAASKKKKLSRSSYVLLDYVDTSNMKILLCSALCLECLSTRDTWQDRCSELKTDVQRSYECRDMVHPLSVH